MKVYSTFLALCTIIPSSTIGMLVDPAIGVADAVDASYAVDTSYAVDEIDAIDAIDAKAYFSVRILTDTPIPAEYASGTFAVESSVSMGLMELAISIPSTMTLADRASSTTMLADSVPLTRKLRGVQAERELFSCGWCSTLPKYACVMVYGFPNANRCHRRALEEGMEGDVEVFVQRHRSVSSQCELAIQKTKDGLASELGLSGLKWFNKHGTFECIETTM